MELVFKGEELKLINCILSNNKENYGVAGDNISISYSNFWNNGINNLYNYRKWIGVNFTTNANGDSCDAYYNIQLNHRFIDSESEDYHLRNDNHCIGAGMAFA